MLIPLEILLQTHLEMDKYFIIVVLGFIMHPQIVIKIHNIFTQIFV